MIIVTTEKVVEIVIIYGLAQYKYEHTLEKELSHRLPALWVVFPAFC